MKKLALLTLALLPLVAPSPARADATSDAKTLFDAGSQAYQVGDFKTAIQAFEQAYKLDARPGLLFSIAQAHRRQYALDRRPGHVAVAIKYFREYLAKVDQGGRRTEAATALGELEPAALQLEIEGKLQPLDDGEPPTRLVVTSPAAGAEARVDGKDPKPLPMSLELPPGKHAIVVSAPGFGELRREIDVAKGAVTALDLPLKELPGAVTLRGPSGAQIAVDGKVVGSLPLARPLDVEAGTREVRISLNGYEPWSEVLDVKRGGELRLDARMPWTTQRKASIGLLVGAGALLAAGAATGSVGLAAQAAASDERAKMDAGQVVCRGPGACPELDRYNDAIRARDAFGITGGVLLGAAAVAGAAGVLLFVFDGAPPARVRRDDAPAAPPKPATLEVGFTGTGIAGRFW